MIYCISKKIEVSAAHQLKLSYESKCSHLHGHNWEITIYLVSRELNQDGMVTDFSHIKKAIKDKLDHACLNDVLDFNPTAENIGKWITSQFDTCYKAKVQESEGNVAIVIDDSKIKGIENLVI